MQSYVYNVQLHALFVSSNKINHLLVVGAIVLMENFRAKTNRKFINFSKKNTIYFAYEQNFLKKDYFTLISVSFLKVFLNIHQ